MKIQEKENEKLYNMNKLRPEDFDLPPKVFRLYQTILNMVRERVNLADVTVSEIAKQAGIGKGTIYEYFSNKDELIAEALHNGVRFICAEWRTEMEKRPSIWERMDYILRNINNGDAKMNSIAKYIQIVNENSRIGEITQKRVHENPEDVNCPDGLIKKIVDEAVSRGEIKADYPRSYVDSTIFGTFISYAIFCGRVREGKKADCTPEEMRTLILEGLKKNLGK